VFASGIVLAAARFRWLALRFYPRAACSSGMRPRPRLRPGSLRIRRRFRLADSAQQLVGGFLLAGPFVVTEEVWTLAASMSRLQAVLNVVLVSLIGYAALYRADTKRDPDAEQQVAGVPIRFISLLIVSFGSVVILAAIFDAPATFIGSPPAVPLSEILTVTFRAISVGAVFSVVGAATADSVF